MGEKKEETLEVEIEALKKQCEVYKRLVYCLLVERYHISLPNIPGGSLLPRTSPV